MKGKFSLSLGFITLLMLLFPLRASGGEDLFDITPLLKTIDGEAVGLRFVEWGRRGLLLTNRALMLFDWASNKELAHYKFGVAEQPLRLDVVERDGHLDIVVTSVSGGELSSYLFRLQTPEPRYSGTPELTPRAFEVVASQLPYFFRVIEKGGEDILVGQRSSREFPFAGGVYEFTFEGGRLRRGERLDLPRRISIYGFAPYSSEDWSGIWVRDSGGQLRLYEKSGRKWKVIYKTSDRYRSDVNCFSFSKEEVMTEDRQEEACVPVPPLVFHNRMIIVASHEFLLGGVILKPGRPRKVFVHLLAFREAEGIVACRQWGPYQGWIGDFFMGPKPRHSGTPALRNTDARPLVVRNSSDKYYGGIKIDKLDVGSVDCNSEF